MPEIAAHDWREIPAELPGSCVLQIHWPHEPEFQHFLRARGFKVVSLARHPLDVMLSVLRFCKYDPSPARWLDGRCDVGQFLGQDIPPSSPKFLDWCVGEGASKLLSVSQQWWGAGPETIRLRYENFVLNPRAAVDGVLRAAGEHSLSVTDNVLEAQAFHRWQALPNKHGWQGRAGMWHLLFQFHSARRIYRRHHRCFGALGYRVGIFSPSWLNYRRKITARWRRFDS